MKNKIIVSFIVIFAAGLVFGLVYLGSKYERIHPLCLEFEKVNPVRDLSLNGVKGEISCDEAIKIAKENFDGEIISVNKTYGYLLYDAVIDNIKRSYIAAPPPIPGQAPEQNSTEKKYDIWVLELKTDETLKTIILDLHTGEVLTNF